MKTERPTPCRTLSQATAAVRQTRALERRAAALRCARRVAGIVVVGRPCRLQTWPLDSFETQSRRKQTMSQLAAVTGAARTRGRAPMCAGQRRRQMSAARNPNRACLRPYVLARAAKPQAQRAMLSCDVGHVHGEKRQKKGMFRWPSRTGMMAPDFDASRRRREDASSLASLKGRPVVVYFYPKDDTSGLHGRGQGLHLPRRRIRASRRAGARNFARQPRPAIASSRRSTDSAFVCCRTRHRSGGGLWGVGRERRCTDASTWVSSAPHS